MLENRRVLRIRNEHEHTQKKTFTKWINNLFVKSFKIDRIQNLYVDLSDGIKLLEIMEILTKKKLVIERKQPMQRVHCLSNVSTLIGFMTTKLQMKLVNIHATDIVDGRPNIILGLVWQIILHFEIKDNQIFKQIAERDTNPIRKESLTKGSPKEALLAWSDKVINEKYGIAIQDFHNSWRDGVAFNAIIHNINPKLVDWKQIKRRNSKQNLESAFRIAEQFLNIPKLLEPEDVDVDYPDEKSIMTYLVQFLHNYPDQDLNKKSPALKFSNNLSNNSNSKTSILKNRNRTAMENGVLNEKPASGTSKISEFESTAAIKLKSSSKGTAGSRQIRQIKHHNKTEDEERKALNEEGQNLLNQIKVLLSNIDSSLEEDRQVLINTSEEEMKLFLPVLENMNELKILNDNFENLANNTVLNTGNLIEQKKIIDKGHNERINKLLSKQWDIESLIPESDPSYHLFQCLCVLEKARILIKDLTATDVEKCKKDFIDQVKSAIYQFQTDRFQIFHDSDRFPKLYLDNLRERISVINDSIQELTEYFGFIDSFQNVFGKNLELQTKLSKWKSNFSNYETLDAKNRELKAFLQSNTIENLKSHLKEISDSISHLTNNFLSKNISGQMTLSQCNQRINDSIKTTLREIEDTLAIQTSFINKWKILNEKKDEISTWISTAKGVLKQTKSERDEFFARESQWRSLYQNYVDEKNSFPTSDAESLNFVQNEFQTINESFNFILSEIENIHHKETVTSLKKEYFERIQRIEVWINKSEAIVERKTVCRIPEIQENLDILEAASSNFETVKNDLQAAAKIGESMFKSNMREVEVEEILGTLHVNKDRFMKVRNEIGVKVKKLDKVKTTLPTYNNNIDDLINWMKTIDQILVNLSNSSDIDKEQIFNESLAELEKAFNSSSKSNVEKKINENKKILKSISEKVSEDVDTSSSEDEMTEITTRIRSYFDNFSIKRKEFEFTRLHMKLMKLIKQVEEQIKEEEIQMNEEKDFSKILVNHEAYFADNKMRNDCCELLEAIKLLNMEIGSSSDRDYPELFDQIKQKVQSTFKKADNTKKAINDIPIKLNDFQERLAKVTDWVTSIEHLSSQLKVPEEGANNEFGTDNVDLQSLNAEEYSKTLAEFEKLYSLRDKYMTEQKTLNKMITDLIYATPSLQLGREKNQIQNSLSKYEKVAPQIEIVSKKAPMIAKSMEINEGLAKRNKRLLELKMQLDQISEEEILEIEDIYQEEQKLLSCLENEAPNILLEIEEGKNLQNQFETKNIITPMSVDLENTWNMVNQIMKNKLEKLQETKEVLLEIENNSETVQTELNNLNKELSVLNAERPDDIKFEDSIFKLENILSRIDDNIEEKFTALSSSVEKAHTKFSVTKEAEFKNKKDNLKTIIDECKENVEKKIQDLKVKNEILNNSSEMAKDFANFMSDKESAIENIQIELQSKINGNILNELGQLKEEIKTRKTSKDKIIKDLLRKCSSDQETIRKRIDELFKDTDKDVDKIIDNITSLENKVETYLENLENINEMEQKYKNELDNIEKELSETRSIKLSLADWENEVPLTKLRRIQNKLEQCQNRIYETLETNIKTLRPPVEKVNYQFEKLQNRSKSLKSIFEEEYVNAKCGMEFIVENEEFIKSIEMASKNVLKSLDKISANNLETFENKIQSINKVKESINEMLDKCEKRNFEIGNQNSIFNSTVVEKLRSQLKMLINELKRSSDKCQEMIATETSKKVVLDATLDDLQSIDEDVENVNNIIKDMNIVFGDGESVNEQLKNIKNNTSMVLSSKIEDISNKMISLNDMTKDERLVRSYKKIKDLASKLLFIEQTIDEMFDFNKWSWKTYDDILELKDGLEEVNDLLNMASEDNMKNIQSDLNSFKNKLESMKKLMKARKKYYPLVDKNNFKPVNLQDLFNQLDHEIADAKERLNQKTKTISKINENWKSFEKKRKLVDENIGKNAKRLETITMKYFTVPGLNSVQKELNSIEKNVDNLEQDLQSLNAMIEELSKEKSVKLKVPLECVAQTVNDLNNLTTNLSIKRNGFNRIYEHVNVIEEQWLYISNIMKKIKKFKASKVFQTSVEMKGYLKEWLENVQCDVEDANRRLEIVDQCIENIKEYDGLFEEMSYSAIITNNDKIKKELSLYQTPMREKEQSFNVEMQKLEELEAGVAFLEKQTYGCLNDLETLNNENISLPYAEIEMEKIKNKLKIIQDGHIKMSKLLKDTYHHFNPKSLPSQLSNTIKCLENAEELMNTVKEKIQTLKEGKENLSKDLQNASNNLERIIENLQKENKEDPKEDIFHLQNVKRCLTELKDLINRIENCEKTSKSLISQTSDEDIQNLMQKSIQLKEKTVHFLDTVDSIKASAYEKMIEKFKTAKEDHDRWINEAEAKIKATQSSEVGERNIESELETLNNLISSIDNGEKIIEDLIIQAHTFNQFELPHSEIQERNHQRDAEHLQNNFRSLVLEIFKQKERLEMDAKRANEQREVLSLIENKFLNNKSKLLNYSSNKMINAETKKENLKEIEEIEKHNNVDIQNLIEMESDIKDLSVKKMKDDLCTILQEFRHRILQNKAELRGNLKTHENVMEELCNLKRETKIKLDQFKVGSHSHDAIDNNYLLHLEKTSKNLERCIEETLTHQNNCLNVAESIFDNRMFPEDISSITNTIQMNVQQLNKQLSIIEEEWKFSDGNLTEWNDTFSESRDALYQLEKSVEEESSRSENANDKEQKYNLCISNKEHLELFKINIRNLENLAIQLKGSQYRNQIHELNQQHKQIVKMNLENIPRIRKAFQQHKDYDTKTSEIKMALDSVDVKSVEEINAKSLKYAIKKVKMQKSKLLDIEKEVKRLKNDKDIVYNETNEKGKDKLNKEYNEITERIKELNWSLDSEIGMHTKEFKSIENEEKLLKSLQNWIVDKRKLIKTSPWNSNDDLFKKKLNEIQNLDFELDAKLNLTDEFDKTFQSNFTEANELDLTKSKVKLELLEMKESLEKLLDEGRLIQQMFLTNREKMKIIVEKHDQIKSKLNRPTFISNLENEMEFYHSFSNDLLEIDKCIAECRSVCQKISQLELATNIHKLMLIDLEKIEVSEVILKSEIKEKLFLLEEKKVSISVFKSHLKSLNNWMDDVVVMYNSISVEEKPAEKLEKQEDLLNKVLSNRSQVDHLRSLANESGYSTFQESAGHFLVQYERLLQNIKKDFSFSQDQQELQINYLHLLNDIESQISTNQASLNSLCSRGFSDIESVSKSKMQALELRKQNSKIQDQLFLLDQTYGEKIEPHLKTLKLNKSTREISTKIEDLLQSINEFIAQCDTELNLSSQYNKMVNDLEDSISNMVTDLMHLERSWDSNHSSMKRIQDFKLKIVENEKALGEVKTLSNSSSLLARSPKVHFDINNFQHKLSELIEQLNRIYEKFSHQTLIKEKYSNLDQDFVDFAKDIQEDIIRTEKNPLNNSGIQKLIQGSEHLHNIQGNLSLILQNDVDKHSDRFLELSEDHRSRARHLQLIDIKIYEFNSILKQQIDHVAKFNLKKQVLEEDIKRVEYQLESLSKPTDLVSLQNNETVLRSLLSDSEEIKLKLIELKNDNQHKSKTSDLDRSNEIISQMFQKIEFMKQKIEDNIKEHRKAIQEFKEYQNLTQTAKSFIKQVQGKLSRTFHSNETFYQLENEIHKINEILVSLDKNESLITDCIKLNVNNLRCFSNDGLTLIQKEIDDINCNFLETKKTADELKLKLEKKLSEIKEKNVMEESIKSWLKKEEKKMKLTDQVDGEREINEEIKRLRSLLDEIIIKQEDIAFLPSSLHDSSDTKHSDLKERCENLLDLVKKTIMHLEKVSSDFKIFNKFVNEWNNWYDKMIVKRRQMKSMPDSNMRDFIRSLLNEKSQKFEVILSISSNGEAVLPCLTSVGRENIKSKLKINKKQWHEIFDDLPTLLEILEEKIKKNESLFDKIEKCKAQYTDINLSLFEEIEETDPVKIHFIMGLENKDRQLQKFFELKQNFTRLNNFIQRLENYIESEENNELVSEINNLRASFNTSLDMLENAKDLCLKSHQNHETFETAFLQAQDYLNVLKKKICLCENMEGSTNSLEARMTRIQTVLTKELMNNEHQADQIFNQLLKSYNYSLTTSCLSEQKAFKERFETIISERKTLDEQLKSVRSTLEEAYKCLESFKLKYDSISSGLNRLRQDVQTNAQWEHRIINKMLETAKSLSKEIKQLYDLGLDILQSSKNSYPLDMAKSQHNQLSDLMNIIERYGSDCDQLTMLQNQFDNDEKNLDFILKQMEARLNSLMNNFTECDSLVTCSMIGSELDGAISRHQDTELLLESLKSLYQKFGQFSLEKQTKNKTQFNKLKQNYERYLNDVSEFKGQFNNIHSNVQETNRKLTDMRNEFDSLDIGESREIPDQKVLKFNWVNGLSCWKGTLTSIKDRLNEINVKSIAHKRLSDFVEKDKYHQLSLVEKSLNNVDKFIKDVNKTIINQEHLESLIHSIRETMHCIDLVKQTFLIEFPINKINLEDKIKEIDKNLNLISSVKRNIDEGLSVDRIGCAVEIEELQHLQKERDQLEIELKSIKVRLNKDLQYWNTLEDRIHRISKRNFDFDEEISNLDGYGITIENKKVILNKTLELKREIVDLETEIDEVAEKLINKTSISFISENLSNIIKKLESQNRSQREKVEKLIEQHTRSIISEEKFEICYKDLLKEIANKKNDIQNIEFDKSNIDNFGLSELKNSLTKLNNIGNECQNVSSAEGKELLSNKMALLEKNLKKLEDLYTKIRLDKEKEEFKMLEFSNQSKMLNEWLEKIKDSLNTFKRENADNVAQKRKKYFDNKKLQNEAKDWKEEMNKHLDTMKDLKSDDDGMEMSKRYREMIQEINFEVSEVKLALDSQTEFDKKTEELMKWLETIENKISSISSKFDCSVEEINGEIKEHLSLQMELMEGKSKISNLNGYKNSFIQSLSLEGQKCIDETVRQISEKYETLYDILKNKINKLEQEKAYFQEYEMSFKEFENWLCEKEGMFNNKGLLATLEEKENCLEKCQNHLLSIYDHKLKLDDLIEKGKKFPLNFILNHNNKGIQIRYSALVTSTQQRVETLGKWLGTHELYTNQMNTFKEVSNAFEEEIKDIKERKENSQSLNDLKEEFEILDNKILKNEDLKLVLNASFKEVMMETSDNGKKDLSIDYFDCIKIYDNVVDSYNDFKSSYTSERIQENQIRNIMENLSISLDGFIEEVSKQNPTSEIQISSLQSFLNEIEHFTQELNQKSTIFHRSVNDYKNNQNETIKELLTLVEKKLKSASEILTKKKKKTNSLLDFNQNYQTSVSDLSLWLEEQNKLIHLNFDVRGSESLINERFEKLKQSSSVINKDGKSMMNLVVEKADILTKNISETNSKEKIKSQINKMETEFFNLTKTAENYDCSMKDITQQWKIFNKNRKIFYKKLKSFASRKEKFKIVRYNYSSKMEMEIDKMKELLNDILQEKSNLELFSTQMHLLMEMSQEPQIDFDIQDLSDQLDGHEIDCKSQIDSLAQIINEKMGFDRQYHATVDMINSLKTGLSPFDQLRNVASFTEYQKLFNELQLLESQIPEGDRMVDDSIQMSNKLSIFFESERIINEMSLALKKNWNNYKEKFNEIKNRMNRLLDFWASLDNLSNQIQSWITDTDRELESMISEGYKNHDVNSQRLEKIKNMQAYSETLKPKVSKFMDLFYKADAHADFHKSQDPLVLQKRFCEALDKIRKLEKDLINNQSNIESLYNDLLEAEKWMVDISLFITDESQKVQSLSNLIDLQNKIQLCKEIKLQIENFDENKVKVLSKNISEIGKLFVKPSSLKSEISMKLLGINQSLKQMVLMNEKFKNIIKQRLNMIKRFQKIIENVEIFLYRELPEWWIGKEMTTTIHPANCTAQIEEVSCLVEKLKIMEIEFEQVCQDQIRQKHTASRMSNDMDSISEESILSPNIDSSIYDNHLMRIKADIAEFKDRMFKKLEALRHHKEKWSTIENEADELLCLLTRQKFDLEKLESIQEDETIYDQFEKSLINLISKKDILNEMYQEIISLSGNNFKKNNTIIKYNKYLTLNNLYSDLLNEMELIRKVLKGMDVHDLCKEILNNDLQNDFTQNVNKAEILLIYPQTGTQTNRNKSTSIHTVRKFASNPNLFEFFPEKNTQTKKDFKTSMIEDPNNRRSRQTVNDIGIQSAKIPMTFTGKYFKPHINTSLNNSKNEQKEKRFQRLNELLMTVRQIKEEISSSNLDFLTQKSQSYQSKSNNSLRHSTESIRHNLSPTKSRRIHSPLKASKTPIIRNSIESLGRRPSPTGCTSPNSFKDSSPRKRSNSPRKSPMKSNTKKRQFAF